MSTLEHWRVVIDTVMCPESRMLAADKVDPYWMVNPGLRFETPEVLGCDGRRNEELHTAGTMQAFGLGDDVRASLVGLSARPAVLLRHHAYFWFY